MGQILYMGFPQQQGSVTIFRSDILTDNILNDTHFFNQKKDIRKFERFHCYDHFYVKVDKEYKILGTILDVSEMGVRVLFEKGNDIIFPDAIVLNLDKSESQSKYLELPVQYVWYLQTEKYFQAGCAFKKINLSQRKELFHYIKYFDDLKKAGND